MKQYRKNTNKPKWVTGAVADDVFRHLEAKPHLSQSKRVEHILELLSRLGKNNGDFYTFSQLREPLKRYEWHYGLTLGKHGLRAELLFTKEMSEGDEWEHRAVRFLLSLVPHHLHRLRRCLDSDCRRWFFAAKSGKRVFCCDNCKQHNHDSDPEERKKKREYMRRLRIQDRERDERRKKTVSFRDRVKHRVRRSKQS